MEKIGDIWILKTSTSGGQVYDLLKEKGVVGMGWSYFDYQMDDYEKYKNECEKKGIKANDNIQRLAEKIKPNDIVWMRSNLGVYSFYLITKDTCYKYSEIQEDRKYDICNQLQNVKWEEVGDESDVPGVISCAFNRSGQTLHRIEIGKEAAKLFSAYEYNKICKNFFEIEKIEDLEKNFFKFISPEDCEDLIYFYLFSKKGYIVVPSTNKKSTPNYDFVMLDPNDKDRRIYLQCKNGTTEQLKYSDFQNFIGKNNENNLVYLFVTNKPNKDIDTDQIKEIDRKDVWDWLLDSENKIISSNIITWLELIEELRNANKNKGIIFDTNNSYDIELKNEFDMCNNKKVAAYGDAKRFVKSFKIDDIAFLYSKNKQGIIGVGKIKSENMKCGENELYRELEWEVKPKEDYSCLISIAEIKKLLHHNFFMERTNKVPYLSEDECKIIIDAIKQKKS